MKKITGTYNGKCYRIFLNGNEIYKAGNAKGCSQTFVSEQDGVGIDKMREYCVQTAKMLAEEHKAEFIGVEADNETEDVEYVHGE